MATCLNALADPVMKSGVLQSRRRPAQHEQILPLDANSEAAIRASQLADRIVGQDHDRKLFFLKARAAAAQLPGRLKLKEDEKINFVYDCLFLVEEGFFLKYSRYPRPQLTQLRQMVIQSFDK